MIQRNGALIGMQLRIISSNKFGEQAPSASETFIEECQISHPEFEKNISDEIQVPRLK